FTLDTHAPTITVTTPAVGSILSASPTVTGSVADLLSGVATLQAQLDGGTPAPVAVDASGHFSVSIGLVGDGTADGAHTVHLRATDGVGNVATADVGFTLVTRPPTISVQSPAVGLTTNAEPVITGTVLAETGSAVASLQAQVDSG